VSWSFQIHDLQITITDMNGYVDIDGSRPDGARRCTPGQ